MEEREFRQADAKHYACPNCGDSLRYDIAGRNLRCGSCGQSVEIADQKELLPADGSGRMEAVEYVCPNCGAAIHTSQTAATSFCSYCGSDVMLAERLTRIRRPAKIVPFRVTRESCEEIYRKRVRRAVFAPRALTAQATIDRFRPVYIPFWEYKGRVAGEVSGKGKKQYNSGGYEITETYALDVYADVRVEGIRYDASVAFEDETAQRLRLRSREAEDFHSAYLCGFYAEAPDVGAAVYREAVRRYAEEQFGVHLKEATETDFSPRLPTGFETEAELVLMPVWLLASRQGERVLYTAVNGHSGDIMCDTPVSAKRFAVLAAALFAALAAFLILIGGMVILRPNLVAALCAVLASQGLWIAAPAVDELILRRTTQTDPTRLMKAEGNRDSSVVKYIRQKDGFTLWPAALAVLVTAVVAIAAFMMEDSTNAMVARLVSDHSWLAPALGASAALMSLFIPLRSEAKKGGFDRMTIRLQQALLIAAAAALLLPLTSIWYYIAAAVLLLPLTVLMARLNRRYNEFVTRPVPIFGGREDE